MTHFSKKFATSLLLIFGIIGFAQAKNVKPNYDFKEFEKVRSVKQRQINGWAPINDQALIMTFSPKRKYLVILQRPDHNLAFSNNLGVTSSGGNIYPRADKVYAMNSAIKLGIPIKTIYKLEGKEQLKLAHELVEKAEKEAEKAKK